MPMSTIGPGYTEDVLVPSAAQTASGSTSAQPGYSGYGTLRVQLNVTAASGTTPSLTLVVEDTLDGTNWNAIDTFPAVTAPGITVRNITTPFADRLRVRWAITGTTPSFTFDVRAAAQAPMV